MRLALHHVALAVPQLEPALAFYQSILGLELLDRPKSLTSKGVWLGLGDLQLHLIEHPRAPFPDEAAHGRQSHLALRISDYAQALEHVRGAGVEVTEGVSGLKQFFFYDPAGNTVEMIQD
jgi:catechol 2,3-dioxygenase-like lactoylglutathione lyase family enzyme